MLFGRAGEGNSELPARITDIDQTDGLVLLNVTDTYTNAFSSRAGDAGDINGDGVTDLILGSPNGYLGSEEGGEVFIVYGTTTSRR